MDRNLKYKMMVFMSRRMIACDEAGFLISYQADHRLGFRRWVQLKFHLLSCHLCTKYENQIKQLNVAVDQYREGFSSNVCQHNLPEESRLEIDRVVSRELNAK